MNSDLVSANSLIMAPLNVSKQTTTNLFCLFFSFFLAVYFLFGLKVFKAKYSPTVQPDKSNTTSTIRSGSVAADHKAAIPNFKKQTWKCFTFQISFNFPGHAWLLLSQNSFKNQLFSNKHCVFHLWKLMSRSWTSWGPNLYQKITVYGRSFLARSSCSHFTIEEPRRFLN